jgi:L-methionine (R)-S-oxide reductase
MVTRADRYADVKAILLDFFEHYSIDVVGRMATICSVIRMQIPELVFVGFYLVKGESRLEIGPYQGGLLACGVIEPGKGVCGTAWANKRTEVVADVRTYPNYIACDEATLSEIVVPIFEPNSEDVYAVLDIDAGTVGFFTEEDDLHLSEISRMIFP